MTLRNKLQRHQVLLFLSLIILIIIFSIIFIVIPKAEVNEYMVHHSITIDLDGGRAEDAYYCSVIDRGDNAGTWQRGLWIGEYVEDKEGSYHYIIDYETDSLEIPGSIDGFFDCVGITPYAVIDGVSKEGYHLAGWEVSLKDDMFEYLDNNGIKVNIGATADEDISIKAIWEKDTYSIDVNTYYLNESGGWTAEGLDFSKCTIDVTINNNTAACKADDYYNYLEKDTSIDINVNPILGWEYSFCTPYLNGRIEKDTVINIYLVPKKYNLTYDAGYAWDYNLNVDDMPPEESFYYSYEKTFTGTSSIPKGNGLEFKGWGLSKDSASLYNSPVNLRFYEDTTLYAIWNYRIRFDKNCEADVDGIMPDETHQLGGTFNISSNTYSRKGYIFTGWNTKGDGNGIDYANSARNVRLMPDNSGYAYLYAIWKPIVYEVHLNITKPDRASNSIEMLSNSANFLNDWKYDEDGYFYNYFTYDKENVLPSANDLYYLKGWRVKGWSISNDILSSSANMISSGKSIYNLSSIQGDIINLYPVWEENSYNLIFDSNGGYDIEAPDSVRYEDDATLPTDVKRPGFTFTGWSTIDKDEEIAYNPGATITRLSDINNTAITFYAQWEKKKVICLNSRSSIYNQDLISPIASIFNNKWLISQNRSDNKFKDETNKYVEEDIINNAEQIWSIKDGCLNRL